MLYRTASQFGQRPSDLTGIPARLEYLRWDFDAAIVLIGTALENRMNERDEKSHELRYRPEQVIADPMWMGGARQRRAVNTSELAGLAAQFGRG